MNLWQSMRFCCQNFFMWIRFRIYDIDNNVMLLESCYFEIQTHILIKVMICAIKWILQKHKFSEEEYFMSSIKLLFCVNWVCHCKAYSYIYIYIYISKYLYCGSYSYLNNRSVHLWSFHHWADNNYYYHNNCLSSCLNKFIQTPIFFTMMT